MEYYRVEGAIAEKYTREQADSDMKELIDAAQPLLSLIKKRNTPIVVTVSLRNIRVSRDLVSIPYDGIQTSDAEME